MNCGETPFQQAPPTAALMQMMTGFYLSAALSVVARLGLPDLLQEGPRSADDLARSAGAHAGALHRLLRALASVGVFSETEPGRFALTPMGSALRTEAPGSLRAFAVALTELGWESWGKLLYSVRTGKPAFEHVHGMGYFEYLRRHPEKARLFDEAMTGFLALNGAAVAAAYDFSPYAKIVDVGGGRGTLLAAVLKGTPEARGVLFDLPDVVERAKENLDAAGVLERCECAGGDFFSSVPSGGSAYLLASVLHDWDDERGLQILRNCRRAMSSRAVLLLVEMVIPPGDTPFFGKLLDLTLLVNFGGRERTEEEYRNLLQAAGFRLARVLPTSTASSLLEAVPR